MDKNKNKKPTKAEQAKAKERFVATGKGITVIPPKKKAGK